MLARRLAPLLVALALALAALLPTPSVAQFFGGGAASQEEDKGVLASLISRALSTPATRVSIGAIEGALSSDATILDLQISDRDGVWLRLDRARIVWRRLALLQRRLEIDRLEVGTLTVARRPIPAEGEVAGENEPLLPELPVAVEIKAFRLDTLAIGEPILGVDARLAATGAAKLGSAQEGLDLTFEARRLDQPGTLSARLGLVPQGQRLTLKVALDEPEGGIAARLAGLPSRPPVKLDLSGDGALDKFVAKLSLEAGPEVGAAGTATLARDGAARRLALDLQGRLGGLLPAAAAPVFAGTTRLAGTAAFPDGGGVTLSGLSLAAAAARLEVSGTISREQVLDLTIAGANVASPEGRTTAGAATLRRLALQGRITGPAAGPDIQATLAVEDAALPAGRLARLDASLKLSPNGTTPGGAIRLALGAEASASGLALADPGLARALGDSLRLTARGSGTTGMVFDLDALEVTTPTVRIGYAGRVGSDEILGRATLAAASLRPFATLARLPGLAGATEIRADLEGTPRANRINAIIDGQVTGFASGIAALDGLFGGPLRLAGTARLTPEGTYAFENLRLAGEGATATLNGPLGQESADLAVAADIPDLRRADPRLGGRASLTARVTGGLQHPDVVASVAVADATGLGRAVPRLALTVTARDLTGALDATFALDGTVDGKPARGGFRLTRQPAGSYALDGLDLALGSVAIRGAVTLDARQLAAGSLTLRAGDLRDLSALLLSEASGGLDATIALDAAGGRQGARIRANGARISLYGIGIERVAADLGIADLFGRPVVSGEAAIDEVALGTERVSQVRLNATGTQEASDLVLTAKASGFDIDAAARLLPGERTRIQVTRLEAGRAGQRLSLAAAPATVTLRPGGAEIAGLALAIGGGRLAAEGSVGETLDLRLDAARLPLAAAELVRPGLGLAGRLDGTARITGSRAAPSGEIRLRAAGVTAPQTRVGNLPPIDSALTGRLQEGLLRLEGSTVTVGRLADLRLDGAAPVTGIGLLDLALAGRVDAGLANGFLPAGLARLGGDVELGLRLAGPLSLPVATLTAKSGRFATGVAALDNLLGGRLDATGSVAVPPEGGYVVRDVRVIGRHLSGQVDGVATPDRADLTAQVVVPDLRRADGRLTGRAEALARITGTLDRPDATLRVAVAEASALGRPIPRLAVEAAARDLLGALDARVSLEGEVDRRPARGALHVARPSSGGTVLDGLDVAIGSARLTGSATLDPAGLATGRVTIAAPNLDDLTPLLLTKTTGSLDLDATLAVVAGGQDLRLKGQAAGVALLGLAISRADADLTVTDAYRRPVVNGRAAIDELTAGGERVSRLRLTAKGAPGASELTLTATARGFDVEGQARLLPGERIRLEVARLAASRGSQRFALAAPATLTFVPGGADLRGAALTLGSGRLTLDGLVGSRLDLKAEARAVPLSAADLVAPGLGLVGTLDGQAQIGGSASAPQGAYRLRIAGLSAPQTRSLGLPRIEVGASGRLEGGRATLDASLAAGRAGSLRIDGSLPVGAGALDFAIKGSIDAGAATTGLLAAGGRRLSGRVAVDARLGGTFAAPEASGAASLAGGTFSDAANGVALTAMTARIVARGRQVTIENASAATRNGGRLTASGRVELEPEAGFPGQIRIAGQNAELVRSSLVTAIANLDLSLAGALARDPRVSGRVDLISADVRVPESFGGAAKPLPGTRHKNPTRTAKARLALEGGKGKGGRAAPPFDASLDLAINAPGAILVHGRGLNAELGGSLRIAGSLSAPRPTGAFALQRGSFQLLTTRLDFRKGRLTFAGDLTPELDFQANAQAGGAAIEIDVTGPASDPTFVFSSSPSLPQDEILSRLLFNSPSGQLSPYQALALAQAAAQYAGGEDRFEDLRRSLGLGGGDLGLGRGPLGAVQRALGGRTSVGVTTGGAGGQVGVGVDVKITDEIRLKGDVGAGGGGQVGIGAQYEW